MGHLPLGFPDFIGWLIHHWGGDASTASVPHQIVFHAEISLLSTAIAAAIGLPIGLFIGHSRRLEFLAVSVANIGRAIPSFAILVLVVQLAGLGSLPTLIALVALAIPPILTNTYVGVQGVDPDTIEAARGVGMREGQVLLRLELPLAAPLIVAGLRTAAVQVVATATLAALVGEGGLGRLIIDGRSVGNQAEVLAGAFLVALLAVATELVFGLVERLVTPRTSSRRRRRRSLMDARAEAAASAPAA